MEAKIVSKEIIKPSSPTPPHLNKYKLSFLDQAALNFYAPIILFFKGPTTTSSSDVLKKSLSELLTHFYTLAGRLKDIYTIDCNDEGVEFVDAYVSKSMSYDFLSHPKQCNNYKLMLPFDVLSDPNELINSKQPLLGIQATHFGCGGIAIGLCIHHCVADVSSMSTFLTSWAKLTLGNDIFLHVPLTTNNSCLFPPQDIEDFLTRNFQSHQAISSTMTTRCFRFDASKLSELRETVALAQGSACVKPTTRYEAVAALLWGATMTISEETQGGISTCPFYSAVDLRRRFSPPLEPNSTGSLSWGVQAQWPLKKIAAYDCLAGKIRESIDSLDHQSIKSLSSINVTNEHPNGQKASKFIMCSSWSKYPFYECDFGWGNPFWLATVPLYTGLATLIDTKDGGIDLWLALDEEEMVKFEQNHDILAFSSSKTTLKCCL